MLFYLYLGFCFTNIIYAESKEEVKKIKILAVSSYDRDYVWSQQTNEGLCEAMLKFGYFDSRAQADEYTKNDQAESAKTIIKKLWMDAKKKTKKEEKAEMASKIINIAQEFKPDLILLGDDDAAEYIGTHFLDTEIPVVFWGVNNTPVKYGLLNSIDKPGHNVTGIYQTSYYKESLELLLSIKKDIKTIAIIGDETSTSRSHIKEVEYFIREKKVPLALIETFMTGDFELFKEKALELQKKADAFYVAQISGMKDKEGHPVSMEEAAKWYVNNIKIPEASRANFVEAGLLCGVDDPGYNQGYEAFVMANNILNGRKPSEYPAYSPARGPSVINKERAKMLGITVPGDAVIERYV